MLPEEPTMPEGPIWLMIIIKTDDVGREDAHAVVDDGDIEGNDDEESHRASVSDHPR